MPDKDGIEGPYADGRHGCAQCGATLRSSHDVRSHRRRCGPAWRETFGIRRGPTDEQRRIDEAVAAALGEED